MKRFGNAEPEKIAIFNLIIINPERKVQGFPYLYDCAND